MDSRHRTRPDPRSLALLSLLVVAISAFLFAVQLLSAAMRTLSPLVRPLFYGLGDATVATLGISWLTAYVMLNGSIVAAVALSLFSADLIGVPQLFSSVAGSRLGAAGIVLLIGGLEFFRRREYSLPTAMRLGVLTFLVSHTIYVPATVLGTIAIGRLDYDGWNASTGGFRQEWLTFFEPLATETVRLAGPLLSVSVALVLFVGSLQLLDHLFERVDAEWLGERVFVLLRRRWVSFGLGLIVTGLTSSVAFSIGVVVPVYNRGDIEREEIVPYVMGASVGTLTDTLIVALVLDSGAGVAVVLLLFGIATLVTLVALVFYEAYYAVVDAIQERLLRDGRAFVAFLVSLVVVPLGLVFL